MSTSQGMRDLINEARETNVPEKRRTSLTPTGASTSLTVTLLKDALRDAGVDFSNPGSIDQYYFEDEGAIVIDLDSLDARR